MSKTVTITLSDDVHAKFLAYAAAERRSLANFIEMSALRYVIEQLDCIAEADESSTAQDIPREPF